MTSLIKKKPLVTSTPTPMGTKPATPGPVAKITTAPAAPKPATQAAPAQMAPKPVAAVGSGLAPTKPIAAAPAPLPAGASAPPPGSQSFGAGPVNSIGSGRDSGLDGARAADKTRPAVATVDADARLKSLENELAQRGQTVSSPGGPPQLGGPGVNGTAPGQASPPLGVDPNATQAPGAVIDGVLNGPPADGSGGTIDEMAEELARKQLAAALAGGDTAEHERILADLRAQATGRSVVNARSAGGRAGMGMSGNMAAMSNDIQQRAARDLALDQIGVRTDEEQRVIGNANEAQRIDIAQRNAASNLADAEARRAALEALLGGKGTGAPPVDPGAGGSIPDPGAAIADVIGIDDGTSLAGKGTDQTQLATSPDNPVRTSADGGGQIVTRTPEQEAEAERRRRAQSGAAGGR